MLHIPPLPVGLDAADGAQLLSSKVETYTGVALDLSLGAAPRPGGVPGDRVAVEGVDPGALLACLVVLLAPGIVVYFVAALLDGAVLVTEVGALAERTMRRDYCGIAHGGQCQGENGDRSEGLHFDQELVGEKEEDSNAGC